MPGLAGMSVLEGVDAVQVCIVRYVRLLYLQLRSDRGRPPFIRASVLFAAVLSWRRLAGVPCWSARVTGSEFTRQMLRES